MMDTQAALRLLQAMIDYFEAGNEETDRAARAIIESDVPSLQDWRVEIDRRREEGEWTGLRGPEAELIAAALRLIRQQLAEGPG